MQKCATRRKRRRLNHDHLRTIRYIRVTATSFAMVIVKKDSARLATLASLRMFQARTQADGTGRLTLHEPVRPEAGQRIDAALLRDSGPLLTRLSAEVGRTLPADYAVGGDALRVSVREPGGATFAIRFGCRNLLGSARYARIAGSDGVALLPAYVAETWEQAIATAPR